jgi:hypothetical protein
MSKLQTLIISCTVLLVVACGAQTNEAMGDASTLTVKPGDAGDAGDTNTDLPQCSPLGGPSAAYCDTTDDGHCMTTVCRCTNSLGQPIATVTVPMVGYDGGC